jgi:hypothetical protein
MRVNMGEEGPDVEGEAMAVNLAARRLEFKPEPDRGFSRP